MSDEALKIAAIYMAAAVIAVPLAKRLGLGSVLGYLLAGVLIGPSLLGLVGDLEQARHVGEFGVVMMLFVVGLELRPRMLWQLRGPILGVGSAQVLITGGLVFLAARAFGVEWRAATAIGMMLALSSTAIVIQSLAERNVLSTRGGQSAFSVLLFQDIAVIPMLALLPLLAGGDSHGGGDHHAEGHASAIGHLHGGLQALIIVGAVVAVVMAGRFILTPLFRYIATTKMRELFTASALLVVVATAWLMHLVGLSAALGTFVAGVVLADSEYRHQLEADIEPFKGLLLGLFFITVGAGLNLAYIFGNPLLIVGLVIGLMGLKFLVLLALAKVFRLARASGYLFAFSLCQAGEFGFVLIGAASGTGVLGPELTEPLTATIALSMALTPLVMLFFDKVVQPKLASPSSQREPDKIESEENEVILAGFGRFGHIVGRLLQSNGIGVTVLDNDAEQVEALGRYGLKAFYGDASRPELLAAAGAGHAKLFICAVDSEEQSIDIIKKVQEEFPHLTILARSGSRLHSYELLKLGIELHRRETLGSALQLGSDALQQLGFSAYRAHRSTLLFEKLDEHTVRDMAQHVGDKEAYTSAARKHIRALDQLLDRDRDRHLSTELDPWESAGPDRPD